MELLDLGNKVFLISDMYLRKTVILQMLEKANSRLHSLPLYLSSTLKICKSSGALFRYAREYQKIQPKSLIQTGDNFYSDCVMAQRLGIKLLFYQDLISNTLEKNYFREEQNLFLQLVAGVR